ncbi:Actin-like protein 10 [Perkinsus olseni]|uniref:Actin-like protein 10 n=1 Tax=Perkinsus olseni TaxID=32597 RepID=A0A7J6QUS2_PEROL|nr:Actin-like protein 10 [Perkinsus olseni]
MDSEIFRALDVAGAVPRRSFRMRARIRYNTYPLEHCAQRMDVGGRVMTNYLKEAIAYNKVDLDDAPLLVEHIRESMCYSAQDFVAEVEASRACPGETTRRYILPDHSSTSNHLGRVVDPRLGEDVSGRDSIDMNHERMVVSEALWQPGSIGILQAGLAEMAARAVMKSPVATRSAVAKKVRSLLFEDLGGLKVDALSGFMSLISYPMQDSNLRPSAP